MTFQLPHFPPIQPRPSVVVFGRSLWAFLLRDFRNRYGVFRLGYFWAIMEPAINVGIFVAIHALIRGSGKPLYGDSPVWFFTLGTVPFFMFSHAVGSAGNTFNSSRGLFNYRQIRPLDIVIAKAITEFLLLGVTFFLFFTGCRWAGIPVQIENPLQLLLALLALFWLALALALCFEVYATVFPELRRVFSLTMRPLFFMSGLFFTMGMVPDRYLVYLAWNPVLHLIDMVRDAAMPGYDSPASWTYVGSACLLLSFIGLSAYRRYLHHLL